MLIKREILERIKAGEVTLQFRRWRRPTVKAGGTLKTAIGVLAIEDVKIVSASKIKALDAHQAGVASRAALLESLQQRSHGEIYRVKLRYLAADPRKALRAKTRIGKTELRELRARLSRFDKASRRGPWTRKILHLIEAQPGLRAQELAAKMGVDKLWFKGNVRKLKELGFTESLEVGYRLSNRGRAFLTADKTGRLN